MIFISKQNTYICHQIRMKDPQEKQFSIGSSEAKYSCNKNRTGKCLRSQGLLVDNGGTNGRQYYNCKNIRRRNQGRTYTRQETLQQ